MSDRDRTDLPEKIRPSKPLLVAAAGSLLAGLLSRFLWRDRDRPSPVERAVHEVREEMGRGRGPVEGPAPTPDQVRDRREQRRRREAEEARR